MEFLYIFRLIRRSVVVILLVSTLASVSTYFLTYLLPYDYDASSLILVRPRGQIELGPAGQEKSEILNYPVTGGVDFEAYGKTFVEIIQSRAFVESIVKRLALDKKEPKEPESDPIKALFLDVKDGLADRLKNVRDYMKYGMLIEEDDFAEAIRNTAANLSVKTIEGTSIFEIKFTDEDAEKAARVANAASDLFLDFIGALSRGELSQDRRVLEEQLAKGREALQEARARLRSFKDEHKVFDLTSEYEEALTVVAKLESDLEAVNAELAGLSTNHRDEHYEVKAAIAQRDALERSLRERRTALAQSATIESVLRELELEVDVKTESYRSLAAAYEEAVIDETEVVPEVAIVSAAVPETKPARPNKLKYSLITFALTLILTVGTLVIRNVLASKISNKEDVRRKLKLRVLAVIPDCPKA